MQTCPGFFLKSLLESPGNLLEICSVKFVETLLTHLSTSLHWLGLRWGVFACAGCQITLCDPIWQAALHSSEMAFH